MIHPLDSIATHLVTQLVDVGADVMDTGGGCTALAWRDPRSPEDYSPITLTDGDHGVAFAHTGVILVTLEDPEGVDQWWEYPATALTVRQLAPALRRASSDPLAIATLLTTLGLRPHAVA